MSGTTTEADLDRCARGKHKTRLTKVRGENYLKCRHCGQLDPIGPCKFFVSMEQPECGQPGVAKVRLRGIGVIATIELCAEHKHAHDQSFASQRTGTNG